MEPVSPVLIGSAPVERVYAENQPEYIPLPVFHNDIAVISRWRPNEAERKHLAEGGDLFIIVLNYGQPLQPIQPIACTEEEAAICFIESTQPK